jgi:hypothetical protein
VSETAARYDALRDGLAALIRRTTFAVVASVRASAT